MSNKKKPKKNNQKENALLWESRYPELMEGLVTPNFNRLLSGYEDLMQPKGYTTNEDSIPDVAGIDIRLMAGAEYEDDMGAIISRIRTSVRRVNSGSDNGITNKEYFKYIHNYRNIVAIHAIGRWAYGTINHFRSTDTLKPWSLFAAKRLDYVTFSDNAANLRAKLNWVRNLLKVYAPLNLDLYRRTESMFSNNYKDSNDIKSQLYTFTLNNWLQFDNPASDVVTEHSNISTMGASDTGLTYANYLLALDSAISAFIDPEYTSVIAGDILKAFGVDNLHAIPYITEDYSSQDIYSEEVLTQIQNATMLFGNNGVNIHELTFSGSGNVTETYTILSNSSISLTDDLLDAVNETYINMYKNNISARDVISASRLQCKLIDYQTGVKTVAYGTELVMGIRFIGKSTGSTAFKKLHAVLVHNATTIIPNTGYYVYLPTYWAVFDWMPRLILRYQYYEQSSNAYTSKVATSMWDANNFSKFDTEQQLYGMHIIALMSLYYCKAIVRVNSNVEEVK